MKLITTLIIMWSISFGQAQDNNCINDRTMGQSYPSIHGKIIISNVGFAPVPAFSFDSPIIISSLSVQKGLLSYDHDFSIGLNGKPWLANNWFRIKLRPRKKMKLTMGINPSLFFTGELSPSGEMIQAVRYLSFDFLIERNLSKNWALQVSGILIHAFDPGALSGKFIGVRSIVTILTVPRLLKLTATQQLFYFSFAGRTDGLSAMSNVAVNALRVPLSIYFQCVQPIWSDFVGNSFKWTTGLVYLF